jgi:glycosyltransferase involved in cell wall biosynthesis
VNAEIVTNGNEGFLASSPDEWQSSLDTLLGDPSLRHAMGARGRKRVVGNYSLQSQAGRLVAALLALSADTNGHSTGSASAAELAYSDPNV